MLIPKMEPFVTMIGSAQSSIIPYTIKNRQPKILMILNSLIFLTVYDIKTSNEAEYPMQSVNVISGIIYLFSIIQ